MKYIDQIAIIAAVSFMGELAPYLIPIPIPGSIYGLLLLFLLLLCGAVKIERVKNVGDFLISLMPIMFVSPLVGLMENVDACRAFIVPILLISTVSTVLVMVVTGLVSQALIVKNHNKQEGDSNDK